MGLVLTTRIPKVQDTDNQDWTDTLNGLMFRSLEGPVSAPPYERSLLPPPALPSWYIPPDALLADDSQWKQYGHLRVVDD